MCPKLLICFRNASPNRCDELLLIERASMNTAVVNLKTFDGE
jgi:hypothetical protein